MKYRVTLSAILLITLICCASIVGNPGLINYQGRLTAIDGTPVPNAAYLVKFTIWNDSNSTSVGNQIWTSDYVEIQATYGLFSYVLGSTNPLPLDTISSGIPLWLGIKIGTDAEQSPRSRLTGVPYSVKSMRTDSAMYATKALTVIRSRDLYHQIIDVNPYSTTTIPIVSSDVTQRVVLYLYGSAYQGTLANHTHQGGNLHGHSFTGSVANTPLSHSHGFSGSTADGGGEHSHTGGTSAVDLWHGHSISIGDHGLSHRHDGPYGGHNHEFTADGFPGTGNYLTISGQTNSLSSSDTGDRTCLQAVKREYLVYDLTSPIGHSASIGGNLGSHSHSFTTANTGTWHSHGFSGSTGGVDVGHSHTLSGSVGAYGDGLETIGIGASALPSNVNVYVDGFFAAGPFSGSFASGGIDITSLIQGAGEHLVELREEGGSGGRLTYNLFVD